MAIFYDLYAGGSGELCAPDSVFKHTPALLQGRRITAVLPRLLHDTLFEGARAASLSHSVFRSDSIRITRSKSPDAFASGRHISLLIMCLFGESSITHLLFNTLYYAEEQIIQGCI